MQKNMQTSPDCVAPGLFTDASSTDPFIGPNIENRGRDNAWEVIMRSTSVSLGLIVSIVTFGCASEADLGTLDKKLSDLKLEVQNLKATVDRIDRERSFDQLSRDFGKVAYLTPGSEGYSVIETDLGRITVQLIDVQPYANGSRVGLRFGNITDATIMGLSGTVEWGSVDKNGSPQNDQEQSREMKFGELRAGGWTSSQLVLEGVPPAQLGFVRIRDITHTGIRLQR